MKELLTALDTMNRQEAAEFTQQQITAIAQEFQTHAQGIADLQSLAAQQGEQIAGLKTIVQDLSAANVELARHLFVQDVLIALILIAAALGGFVVWWYAGKLKQQIGEAYEVVSRVSSQQARWFQSQLVAESRAAETPAPAETPAKVG